MVQPNGQEEALIVGLRDDRDANALLFAPAAAPIR